MKNKLFSISFLLLVFTGCSGPPQGSDDSIGSDEFIEITAKSRSGNIGRIYFLYDYNGTYSMTIHQTSTADPVALSLIGDLDLDLSKLSSSISSNNSKENAFCVDVKVYKTSFDYEDHHVQSCFDELEENEGFNNLFSVLDKAYQEGETENKEQDKIRSNYNWQSPITWFSLP